MHNSSELIIKHFGALLNAPVEPSIPEEMVDNQAFCQLHDTLIKLRAVLRAFSKGDLTPEITFRGFSAGALKALQAHLRHLVWQVQQVEKGDFSQRIDFLGDFSSSFNSMIIQLDTILTALRQKEESLLELTRSLQEEVELRKSAMHALRQSEAKFKYLAEHDPLTECLNRRSFFALASSATRNATLTGEACCLALMDIDSFKVFNDTYGHLDGDAALKHVVKVAAGVLRNADIMGRYGGEEFIFYFASADLDQGLKVAERICKAIASTPLTLPSGKSVSVTASLGVSVVLAYWPGERDSYYLQQITRAADAALYEAKANGRNQVCCAALIPPVAKKE